MICNIPDIFKPITILILITIIKKIVVIWYLSCQIRITNHLDNSKNNNTNNNNYNNNNSNNNNNNYNNNNNKLKKIYLDVNL
jgi:hypothetical protein